MKVIKLVSPNIIEYWNVIKYAVQEANGIPDELKQKSNIALAESLLTKKHQCWFAKSDDGHVKTVLITRITSEFGVGRLVVDVIYGYAATTEEEQKEIFEAMLTFAKNSGCHVISGTTDNPVMIKILDGLSFHEKAKVFERMVN